MATEFEITLIECVDGNFDYFDQIQILRSLINECANLDFSTINLKLVSSLLHTIYTSENINVVAAALNLCAEIELYSPTYITEECNFDKLISLTLDAKYKDFFGEQDPRKISAINYTFLLVQIKNKIPQSVVLALLSLCKSHSDTYKPLVINILSQAVTTCENIPFIHEIGRVFTNELTEGNSKELIELIKYGAEHNLKFVQTSNFLSPLVAPLTQIPNMKTEPAKLDSVTTALTRILCTWPGLIIFGVNQQVLGDVLRSMQYQPAYAAKVLRNVLVLGKNSQPIESFTGFALSFLLKYGVLSILNTNSCKSSEVADLLNELIPFLSIENSRSLSLQAIASSTSVKPATVRSNSIVFKLSQTFQLNEYVTSVTDITLGSDLTEWNWQGINKLLFVILPENNIDIESPAAIEFYKALLNAICSNFLTIDQSRRTSMCDLLNGLFNIILSRRILVAFLELHNGFRNMMESTISQIAQNKVDSQSPHWHIFDTLMRIISGELSASVVEKWGLSSQILSMSKTATEETALAVIKRIQFEPNPKLSIPLFKTFLEEDNNSLYFGALSILRSKQAPTKTFREIVFPQLIMTHIKEIKDMPDKLRLALNLLCECISNDEICLEAAAADSDLLSIIRQNSHEIYSIFLRRTELLQVFDLEEETKWWVEQGNSEYVGCFQAAQDLCFDSSNYLEKIQSYPSIYKKNNDFMNPPHIFREITSTPSGLEVLTQFLPEVVKKLDSESLVDCHGAILALGMFGSVPQTAAIVEEFKLPELIIAATSKISCVSLGVTIASMSLFYNSAYFTKILKTLKWSSFVFGPHRAVIPDVSPTAMSYVHESDFEYSDNLFGYSLVPPPDGYEKEFQLLNNLSSPFKRVEAQKQLNEIIKSNPERLKNESMAPLIVDMLSKVVSQRKYRTLLADLVIGVPIVPRIFVEIDQEKRGSILADLDEYKKKISRYRLSDISHLSLDDLHNYYEGDGEKSHSDGEKDKKLTHSKSNVFKIKHEAISDD